MCEESSGASNVSHIEIPDGLSKDISSGPSKKSKYLKDLRTEIRETHVRRVSFILA